MEQYGTTEQITGGLTSFYDLDETVGTWCLVPWMDVHGVT